MNAVERWLDEWEIAIRSLRFEDVVCAAASSVLFMAEGAAETLGIAIGLIEQLFDTDLSAVNAGTARVWWRGE